MIPNQQSIVQAHSRISRYIHKTPLVSSETISKLAGTQALFFKCQNFQKTGAYKVRGVCNAISSLKDPKIVCAHSTGNHAMAVSYIAKQLGLSAYVVMPENSPLIKKKSVESYGANLIISGNDPFERQKKCNQICQSYNADLIHPQNNYDLIKGHATCSKEIFDEKPNYFDYILFPIGGGGLGSGTVLSTKYFGGHCIPIGVQPYQARDTYLSLKEKKIIPPLPPISIADGLRTNLGEQPFKILSQNLPFENVILVSEKQIIDATQLVFERMKMVIEPSSATVVAAVLKDERFKGKKVCCIISGGNIDMSSFFDNLREKV